MMIESVQRYRFEGNNVMILAYMRMTEKSFSVKAIYINLKSNCHYTFNANSHNIRSVLGANK